MKNNNISFLAVLPSVGERRIELSAKGTVKDLKEAICREFKLEPEYVKLVGNDKILDEGIMLDNLNLPEKTVTVDYLWARHLLLWGLEQQLKIRKATVFVAGAGAIGNELCKNLAMLGVKRLVIVDFDTVELSNVSRMFLFGLEDVGKSKAEVLGAKIAEKYPFVEVYAYTCTLERLPLEVFLNSDVIASGLDNIASRMFLATIARKYQIPLVDAGTLGYRCRVQTYIPPDTACPICNFPAEKYAEFVKLKNPCDPRVTEDKTPSLITANTLAASIQTQEILKIIAGYEEFKETGKWPATTGQPLRDVLIADLKFNKSTLINLKRNPECVVCGKSGIAKTAERITITFDLALSTTSELYEQVKKHIGKNVTLYTTRDSPPKKIIAGKNLAEYKLDGGGYVVAIADNGKPECEEAIIKIIFHD